MTSPSIWLWLVALIVGSFFTGVIKTMLGIEIYSRYKYGAIIYSSIDAVVSAIIIYVLWSVMAGHWLK